jgi:hypothetical protein
MNIKLKWFIHKYYFAIAVSVLLIVIIFVPFFYLRGADWKVLLTVIGGLASFFFFIQKQELDEAQFINELLVKFNARYDCMNEELNAIVRRSDAKLESDDINNLFDYFNLCGEEYLFYQRGYIYPEVWRSWVAGMKYYYNNPRIQKLWVEELSSESYYGLDIDREIKQLRLKA